MSAYADVLSCWNDLSSRSFDSEIAAALVLLSIVLAEDHQLLLDELRALREERWREDKP